MVISIDGEPQPPRRGLRECLDPAVRIPQKSAPVLRKNAKLISEPFLAANRMPLAGKMLGCADLALVYGKASSLSPFPGAFRAFLVTVLEPQEIGSPLLRQGLRFGPAPCGDPGMVTG